MDATRNQQKALDDELVAPANRLKIGKSNLRLSSNLKFKEPTLQVVLDALKLTPFYNIFEITANVPEIYMQELWVTVTRHHSLLRFKLNGKSHTMNVDNFRDMLKIYPKLPGQKFEEPLLEERPFAAIISKCLSGKTTALESLRLSRAQILWGMYNNKKVDYVYLLWEDLVFQVENKNSKKNNDMYYPRFTKVIVDYFMAKDQAIPRRNKLFWHIAKDDFMFITVRVISKHKDIQVYGAILPQHLTNQAMLEFEAFITYRAYDNGEKTSKPKSIKKKADSESSPKTKPTQASKGKRIKTSAKGDKPSKVKQSATKSKGLRVLSEVALSEADQMKLATKRSLKEFHSSHASGSGDGVDLQSKVPDEQQQTRSGTNEGAGNKPEHNIEDDNDEHVSEDDNDEHDTDDDNDKHDSANDNYDEDDNQENVSGETESDDDKDDLVHPNLSTYKADDQEDEYEDEKENDDDDDNVMGGEQEDKEDEELYGDLNINMNRSDAEMTDAQINQETEEVHVTLTIEPPVAQQESSSVSSDFISKFINPSLVTSIDSILNPNVQSDIPVNVSVPATIETPSSDTTIPQSPTPIIQPQQQTPDSTTTTTTPTTTVLEILNFASLFGFERRVSSLEIEPSELKQTNQFAKALSSIPGIVDNYLASKMKDEVNDQVKVQVSKILPKVEKYVTEILGDEVLARSSNQPQSSYAMVASLSEFELNKILIDKIEENKSINRSDVQKNLYNALLESYNSYKDIFSSYGDVVTIKRRRDDQDKDEEPS
ncbi:hypothetical protein Tco_0889022, partial [Tanacetum coccineum]